MTQLTREQALAHFGVKGMRWGVRTASPSSTSSPKKGKVTRTGNAVVKALKWSPISKETREKLNTSKIKPIAKIQKKQRAAHQAVVNKMLAKIGLDPLP